MTNLGLSPVGSLGVGSRLKKVNLGQDHLVVQTLELLQKSLDESESLSVGLGLDQTDEKCSVEERISSYCRRDVAGQLERRRMGRRERSTHSPASLVSKFCLKKTRFSVLAHSMLSLVHSI